MSDIFLDNGFSAAERDAAFAGAPGKIHFLSADFLQKYFPLTKLPAEAFTEISDFAALLQSKSEYRALLWHLYSTFCLKSAAVQFPEIMEPFGVNTGKIYILLLMALIPFYEERAIRENFPVKYARDAADRIGSTAVFYAQKYNGALGILAKSLNFMLHYKNSPCFRIGRLDFEMYRFDEFLPEIYVCGDRIIALCQDDWMFDARGERTHEVAEAVQTTRIIRTAEKIIGTPIDMINGYAEKEEISLDSSEWERLAGPGDWTIHYHIPGGGGMTPELCAASFAEAEKFFADYFPDKPVRVIWSNSWFFNPAYKEYMPESNIAKLSRSGYLFPVLSTGKDGLFFVFGRDDDDFASYECKTSLQKAVMRCQKEHGFLRRTGWFITIK